jgi:cytochrome P450
MIRVPPADAFRQRAPGPPGTRLLGHVQAFRRDPLGFLRDSVATYGDVVRFRFGPTPVFLLRHPDDLHRVLQTNAANYTKDTIPLRRLGFVLGRGLVTSEGMAWYRQRRLVQPAFSGEALTALSPRIEEAVRDLVDRWAAFADTGITIDLHQEMSRHAFRVVGTVLLRMELGSESEVVRQATSALEEAASDMLSAPVVPPRWFPTRRNRAIARAVAALDRVVYGIIARRRREQPGDDLLDRLIARPDGPSADDRQARDEIVTLLLAGHENTGSALAWTWYLLASHPRVFHRLRDELGRKLQGRLPVGSDLPNLRYTRQVLMESLRLFPPAWLLARSALGDDTLGGQRIPRGSLVLLCPFLTHRHPDFWPDPERFDPDRFAPGAAWPQRAWLPFGLGRRYCVGSMFALIESGLTVAALAQRYRVRLVSDTPVEPRAAVTLLPREALAGTVHSAGT